MPPNGTQPPLYQNPMNFSAGPANPYDRKPKRLNKRNLIVGAVAALVMFGFGMGAVSAGTTPPVAVEPTPASTVTVTAKPQINTVTVTKTPQSCIDALDKASAVIGVMSKAFPLASQAITAAGGRDVAGLNSVTSQMNDLNSQLAAASPGLVASVQSCRSSQ